jgi:hypothetical protein
MLIFIDLGENQRGSSLSGNSFNRPESLRASNRNCGIRFKRTVLFWYPRRAPQRNYVITSSSVFNLLNAAAATPPTTGILFRKSVLCRKNIRPYPASVSENLLAK